MKRNYVWATALLMLAACSNEEVLPIGEPVGNDKVSGKKVTVTATISGSDSRVVMQEEGNTIKVSWDDVYPERFTVMTTTPYNVTSDADEAKYVFTRTTGNSFTGVLPEPVNGQPYYAIYPEVNLINQWEDNIDYSVIESGVPFTTISANKVHCTFHTQEGTLDGFINKPPMYAASMDGMSFQFRHLAAIVKFTLKDVPLELQGKEVDFEISLNGKIAYDSFLDLTKSTPVLSGGAHVMRTFMHVRSVALNDNTCTFYAYLPPCEKGTTMTISAASYTDDYIYIMTTADTELTKNIEAGKFYRAERELECTKISRNMTAGTVEDLKAWMEMVQEYGNVGINLTLTNDIDLSGMDLDGRADDGCNWPNSLNLYDTIIDGAGHTITGLKMTYVSGASMFNIISNYSVIKNLNLADVDITCVYGDVAGIASLNSGTISGCSITGSIKLENTTQSVAGVVGVNYGLVEGCYNGAIVVGGSNAGGIVGSTERGSTIKACYNTGSVSGASNVGGVVGSTDYDTTVKACYNTGPVSGTSNVGGVIGNYNNMSNVSYCYWNCTGAEYGLGSMNSEMIIYTGKVDNTSGNTWEDAMNNMNYALGNSSWIYVVNNGENTATVPLKLSSK